MVFVKMFSRSAVDFLAKKSAAFMFEYCTVSVFGSKTKIACCNLSRIDKSWKC